MADDKSVSPKPSSGIRLVLPDRKTFIATLSGTAFVLGLTGGSIYAIRKARAQALREAASATTSPAIPIPRYTPTFVNPNISRPNTNTSTSAAASAAATSVFDQPQNNALPSVLQRRPVSSPTQTQTHTHTKQAPPQTAKEDHTDDSDSLLGMIGLTFPQDHHPIPQETEYKPRGFFDTPLGLSLKAFVLATALVGTSVAAVVEITRRSLGLQNMDDFVLKMTDLVPSRSAGTRLVPSSLRSSTEASDNAKLNSSEKRTDPLPLSEALDELGRSESIQGFLNTLKTQLDAERDAELSRRFSSLDLERSSSTNDVVPPSSSSSLSYTVHSPFESRDKSWFNPLGISPVLPSTAFALGFFSGVATAGKKAGLVFLAENAHRLPDTVQGWYFYNKTKNYRVLLAAVKGGFRSGTKTAAWTGAFCIAERLAQISREYVLPNVPIGHWADGTLAGAVTALGALSIFRLRSTPAIRVVQLGLFAGCVTGGLRDTQERLQRHVAVPVADHVDTQS